MAFSKSIISSAILWRIQIFYCYDESHSANKLIYSKAVLWDSLLGPMV